MQTLFAMVTEFHEKFGLGCPLNPHHLDIEEEEFRIVCLKEELQEYLDATSLEDKFDALIDLIYFAVGSCHRMGLDLDEGFARVHVANMAKEQKINNQRRGHKMEVTKPEDWTAPDLSDLCIIEETTMDGTAQSLETIMANKCGLICLDGPDATGKTTLANRIAELSGGHVVHLTWTLELEQIMHQYRMSGIEYAIALSQAFVVVLERPWICNKVYGELFRGGSPWSSEMTIWKELVESEQVLEIVALPAAKADWLTHYEGMCDKREELHGKKLEEMSQVWQEFHGYVRHVYQEETDVVEDFRVYDFYEHGSDMDEFIRGQILPKLNNKGA